MLLIDVDENVAVIQGQYGCAYKQFLIAIFKGFSHNIGHETQHLGQTLCLMSLNIRKIALCTKKRLIYNAVKN